MSFISTEILFVITLNSQYLCYLFFIANVGRIIITTIIKILLNEIKCLLSISYYCYHYQSSNDKNEIYCIITLLFTSPSLGEK